MLVDTGATVTVVSINLLKHDFSYNDWDEERNINGQRVQVKCIRENNYRHWYQRLCLPKFAVAPDGILGFDFQRTQDCTINVAKGRILIHGHKVSLLFERQLGCYQEATLKPARMPALRETIVERKGKRFLQKEQCPVYKQLKENWRLSAFSAKTIVSRMQEFCTHGSLTIQKQTFSSSLI